MIEHYGELPTKERRMVRTVGRGRKCRNVMCNQEGEFEARYDFRIFSLILFRNRSRIL